MGQALGGTNEAGLPRPVSADIFVESDKVVKRKIPDAQALDPQAVRPDAWYRNDARDVMLRGTHGSSKLPGSPNDPFFDVAARELK